jgi:uncharacterized membrane protein
MQQCAFRRFFLGTALVFGLLYALLVPPFQSPDETAHFYRTAHLASGHLMAVSTTDMRLGGYLPKSLPLIYQPFAGLRYDFEAKALLYHFRKSWEQPLNPSDTAFVDFPNVGYYAPFPYIAQGLVLRALMAFDCRPLVLFYAGRLTTLAVWMALIMAALRLLPILAPTMAWLALLPSSLFLHASLSGDAVTNGLCFWLLAALLSLIFTDLSLGGGKQAHNSRWLVACIFVCSAMIVLSKPVYFPLVLLAWLVPKGKFQQNRGYYAFAGGLLLLNLSLLAWWYHFAGNLFIPYGAYNPLYREGVQLNEGVWPHQQLDFVLKHPFGFLKTAVLSYAESAPATLAHYFGKFGWEKNYLPGWLIGLLALGSFALALTDEEAAKKLKALHRISLEAIGLAMMGALALVLYMQWMPVGSDRILALSGRYFFAVFPLLFFAVGGLLASQNKRWVGLACKILLVVSLAWGAWEVLGRYYP